MTTGTNKRLMQLTASKPLVALLDGRDCDVEMNLLRDIATVAFCNASSTAEIHERVLAEATGVLVWHTLRLTHQDIKRFQSLKVIVRIGCDVSNIDLKAAGEMGIVVCNVPSVGVEEIADTTMSMILNLYRQTIAMVHTVHKGERILNHDDLSRVARGCTRIRGDTLGLIGLGKVGTAVAIRAKAFGFKVVFYDPYIEYGTDRALGLERTQTLCDLLYQSDCISLHCSLNSHNREMINAESIKQMREGVFIVNTAQADLINEMDLANGLKDGTIQGAAIDVHQCEPSNVQIGPLRDAPNLYVTPHTAFYSDAAAMEMRHLAASEMRMALLDCNPVNLRNCVNRMYLKPNEGELANDVHGHIIGMKQES